MAKNKNETAAEKIARITAELEAAKAEVAAEETARLEKLANIVRGFPKQLGVATMGDVISLIKQVEKGTLGKLDASAGRAYVKLTDEQKVTVKARLAKGEQVSVLANEYGVSTGTIYNLKKDKEDSTPATEVAAPVAAS